MDLKRFGLSCFAALLTALPIFAGPVAGKVLDENKDLYSWEFSVNQKPSLDIEAKTIAERMQDLAPHFDVPTNDPAFVMPIGSGDFSAMLCYETAWEFHLSKSDYFAVEAKPYHKSPTIHSPGHVSLDFGVAPSEIQKFDQHIDLPNGSVVLHLETPTGKIRAEAFGLMGKNALLVAVEDSRSVPSCRAAYSIWREEASANAEGALAFGSERHDYDEKGRKNQPEKTDRMFGLGYGVAVVAANEKGPIPVDTKSGAEGVKKNSSIEFHGVNKYWIAISCETTCDGEALRLAKKKALKLASSDKVVFSQENTRFWKEFWRDSYVDLYGSDAERLTRLWYVTLYSYACVARGSAPAKFNGGPGLVTGDLRSWGWGYWFQNTRELLWPLSAANKLIYFREYLDFYDAMFMTYKASTLKRGKVGIRVDEMALPSKPETKPEAKQVSAFDPTALEKATLDHTMENAKSGYNVRSLCQGAELVQMMFDYVSDSGDRDYYLKTVGPWLKETTLFYLSWLKKEDDGLYHMTPSDAIEMWWKVKDPITDLSAIRFCFWKVLAHGDEFGYEKSFMDAVRDRAEHLPPLPRGFWKRVPAKPEELPTGTPWYVKEIVVPSAGKENLFAPAAGLLDDNLVHNQENPELYPVFPFAMADANASKEDYERAVNTFKARQFPNSAGWSQCPVQAARLRLPETIDVILQHADRHQKFPFGGWNSPATAMAGTKTGATDTPYFDAAGVNLTALQEALLQSHFAVTPEKTDPFGGGPVVLLPAVRKDWYGRFRLRARGGFLLSVSFQKNRRVEKVKIESERGNALALANPFGECRVLRDGKEVLSSRDRTLKIETKAGEILECVGK